MKSAKPSGLYLKQVLGSMGRGQVLLPRLAQFLDTESIELTNNTATKRNIVRHDSLLTIRAMRHRYNEFSHGIDDEKFAFHPSALGQCLRKLWFEYYDAPRDRKYKDDVLQMYMIFEIGTYLHVILQNLCIRAGFLVKREFQLYNEKDSIVGTCDGVLKIDGQQYLLEIKSINSGQWTGVQQAPKFEHKQQIMAYMHSMNLKWGIIVYINKDRGTMKEFVLEYDNLFYAANVKDRIVTFKKFLHTRTMPDREGTSPRTYPCSFCPFTTICYTPESVMALQNKVRNENTAKTG